jgi:type IV fimbrial biogenesis protein FimT
MPNYRPHIAIRARRSSGFTMVERLITVAIFGILSALAVPSFTQSIQSMRVSTVSSEFVASLNLTRNAAIQRNGNITIAKLAGTDCPNNDQWSCGWQVFVDVNGNGTLNSGTDTLIHEFKITNGVSVVRSASGVSMTANRWGQLNGNGTAGFTLTPQGVGVSSPATTTICINSGGRVRVIKGSVTC